MMLFVYGTLKRGGSNHSWLEGQRFVSEAATLPVFRLYEIDGYPGMIFAPEGGESVRGEVWDVDEACLARLDALEDVEGGEYAREVIPLIESFGSAEVQGYRYLRSISGRRRLEGLWVEKLRPE
jgi:gamma-glutamylcyclotransferase (GGCT)/AIG2-like uncharacterized protein YtfP